MLMYEQYGVKQQRAYKTCRSINRSLKFSRCYAVAFQLLIAFIDGHHHRHIANTHTFEKYAQNLEKKNF